MLFRDLKAYQHALRVAALSRPLIKRLPASEHDLADQWRRASNSIALNLAEGITRKGSKEFRRFADMARGSLHEVEAIIDLAQHLGLSTYFCAVFCSFQCRKQYSSFTRSDAPSLQ